MIFSPIFIVSLKYRQDTDVNIYSITRFISL